MQDALWQILIGPPSLENNAPAFACARANAPGISQQSEDIAVATSIGSSGDP
jgi:hypothetical protein